MTILERIVSDLNSFSPGVIDFIREHRTELFLGTMAAGLGVYLASRPRNLPPGPRGLPLVGYAPYVTEYFPQDFTKLGKIHGDVFSFYYGSRLVVVLNSHEAVKEAFIRQPDDFSHRPPEFDRVMQLHDDVFIPPYHDECKKSKRMASSWLRKVGLGSGPQCEAMVSPEIRALMTYIRSCGDVSHDADSLVYKMTGRIECLGLFGERHGFDDPELKYFTDIVAEWNKVVFGEAAIFSQIPTLTSFALWRKKWRSRVAEVSAVVRDYVRGKVIEHRKNFNPNNIKDFIDNFILEKGVDYDLDSMTGTTMIFTPDTTDTLALSMKWLVLFLAAHPKVQDTIQSEIDDVIGSAHPSLQHRPQMPYTEAVLLEVLRLNSVFGTSFSHSTPWDRDVKFWGYTIPKKTFVFANIYGIHLDERVFSEPKVFKPERFLDESGKVFNSDKVLAFSSGKRMCMGEQQAKSVQFLFITNFVQQFTFKFPPEEPPPKLEHKYDGMATGNYPFKINIIPRNITLD